MCGRFATAFLLPEKLQHYFHLDALHPFVPSFNIAPSLHIPAIRAMGHQRILTSMTWGLLPRWAKEPNSKRHLFNARMETLSEKPSFRDSFIKKRCIVPASGFYEWQEEGEYKQPIYIHHQDHEPLAFAGLWDSWSDPKSGEVIESCAIITTPASGRMEGIHERMPAILAPEDFSCWLDPLFRETEVLQELLVQQCNVLEIYAVADYVNNPLNQGEECLLPLPSL